MARTHRTFRRLYEYQGKELNINEIMAIAKVPCSKSRMYDRLRNLGVVVAVECEDFETLRRRRISDGNANRPPQPNPDLPIADPLKIRLENLIASFKALGIPERDYAFEVKKRISYYE